MGMLPARHYESEHTRFIRELVEKKPELPEKQREARAIWWDKNPEDLELRRRMETGRVPQRGYVYHSDPTE